MKLTEMQGCYWWRYSPVFIGGIRSLNRLVLGDHVLRLGRWWSARLSCIGGLLQRKGRTLWGSLGGQVLL